MTQIYMEKRNRVKESQKSRHHDLDYFMKTTQKEKSLVRPYCLLQIQKKISSYKDVQQKHIEPDLI